MAQKIKIQDGIVVFAATDPQYDVNFGINGILNVTQSAQIGTALQVGGNTDAAGTVTTASGQNLTLTTGTGGHLNIAPSGALLLNGSQWPINNQQTTSGSYLGVSPAPLSNTLQFFPFILAITGSDTLTPAQLDISYPTIQSGQTVVGPTVKYFCVTSPTPGPSKWSISQPNLGYTPVNKAGDSMTGLLILSGDPVNTLGAVTKQYVDQIATNINIHDAVQTATTAAGNVGNTFYYPGTSGGNFDPNGTGVGAVLKAQTNGYIDSLNSGTGIGGTSTLVVGSRVLIKDQTNTIENGVYVINDIGADDPSGRPWALVRASDYDNSAANQVHPGDVVYIQDGTLSGTQWVQVSEGSGAGHATIIGTDTITFTQFSGAGTLTSGDGISISGNTISNAGVLSNIGSSGISVSSATGNVTINNTGVVSVLAGTNIAVSTNTGNVIVSVDGTVQRSYNLAGGLPGNIAYQFDVDTTALLPTGTNNQVLISGNTPSWTNTPTLLGTNFNGIPNAALVHSSIVIGTSSVPLGAGASTISGLTLVAPVIGDATGSSLTVTNNITSSNGFNIKSISNNITSSGTTLATAFALISDINMIVTAANNSGVAVPSSIPGMNIIIFNSTAISVNVYPDSPSGYIDSIAVGSPYVLAAGARIMFFCTAYAAWHTLNATYF